MVKARETNTSRPGVVESGDVWLAFWTAEKRNFFKIPCSKKYYFWAGWRIIQVSVINIEAVFINVVYLFNLFI